MISLLNRLLFVQSTQKNANKCKNILTFYDYDMYMTTCNIHLIMLLVSYNMQKDISTLPLFPYQILLGDESFL